MINKRTFGVFVLLFGCIAFLGARSAHAAEPVALSSQISSQDLSALTDALTKLSGALVQLNSRLAVGDVPTNLPEIGQTLEQISVNLLEINVTILLREAVTRGITLPSEFQPTTLVPRQPMAAAPDSVVSQEPNAQTSLNEGAAQSSGAADLVAKGRAKLSAIVKPWLNNRNVLVGIAIIILAFAGYYASRKSSPGEVRSA